MIKLLPSRKPVSALEVDAIRVDDAYANLDKRTLEGYDIGVYYDIDTDIGTFSFRYNGSYLDKFEQEASGDAALLVASQASGAIPANIPIDGFADLVGRDGNQEERHRASLRWRRGDFGASLSGISGWVVLSELANLE